MSANDDLSLQNEPPRPPPSAPPAPSTPPAPPPAPPPAAGGNEFMNRMGTEARQEAAALKGIATAGGLMDFLNFKTLIYPMVVKYLFLILLLLNTVSGLWTVIYGFVGMFGGATMVYFGFLQLIVGPILLRAGCEGLLMLFKIHDELKKANDKK